MDGDLAIGHIQRVPDGPGDLAVGRRQSQRLVERQRVLQRSADFVEELAHVRQPGLVAARVHGQWGDEL